jgi:cytochrome P450
MPSIEVDLGDDRADITSHDTFVRGVPHATFDRLRRDDPVSWWDEADGGGFWAVTRYDDVLEVSRQTERFSSASGIRLEEMDPDELEARRTLMEMDPPGHTGYRRLVSRAFTRKEVALYEEAIRALAKEVVDEAQGSPRLDFVDLVARPLPMRMLARLLGLADADGSWLVTRGDALLANTDPEFTDFVVDQVDTTAYRLLPFRSPVSAELFDYARRAGEKRKDRPGDDLLSLLLRPMPDGEHLTEAEFQNFFTLLVAAGNDTTRFTMAAGMKALIERPELLRSLNADPARLTSTIEEILRWSSVTMHFRRTARSDTEMRGKSIRAGDKVLIWFVAANFDSGQFVDPYHFDPDRAPNDHLTFGRNSPHLCLGAHLARIELKVLFQELLPRIESVRIDGPTERLRSNFINGIKHLPVEISWR